mgnify:CR=1 FL=1
MADPSGSIPATADEIEFYKAQGAKVEFLGLGLYRVTFPGGQPLVYRVTDTQLQPAQGAGVPNQTGQGAGFPVQPAGTTSAVPEIIEQNGRQFFAFRDQYGNLTGVREVEAQESQQQPLPSNVQLPDQAFVAQLRERGFEPEFDVRTQQWVPVPIPEKPPQSWQERVMEFLIAGKDQNAQELWSFWNQMGPGEKAELALQLSTAPGDFVTYWSALRSTTQNVPFELGVRRFPLADILVNTVAQIFNLPVGKNEAGALVGEAEVLQAQAEDAARHGPGFPSPESEAILPGAPLPTPTQPLPSERFRGDFTSAAVAQAQAQAEDAARHPDSSGLPTPALPTRPLPSERFRAGFTSQAGVQGSPLAFNPPAPLTPPPTTESGVLDAKVVLQPQAAIVGDKGPEVVMALDSRRGVGFRHLPGFGFDEARGTFGFSTPEARMAAMPGLPAFGATRDITKPRLLPSLGAPAFRSAQQLRFTLPSEQAGFRSAVAQTGIPIEDFLFQEALELPRFGRRPPLRFQSRAVRSAV